MYRSSLLLLLSLIACSSGSDKGGTDSGSDDAGDFAPQEGAWEGGETIFDDACGLGMEDDIGEDPGGMAITLTMDADGGGFTVIDTEDNEDEEPIICTLDGQSFTCDTSDDDMEDQDFAELGFDAVMTMDQVLGGDFSSETAGEFRMVIDVGCEGADCAEVAEMIEIDMPCISSMSVPLLAG